MTHQRKRIAALLSGIVLVLLGGCQAVSWSFEADKPRPDLLAADFPEEDTIILHRSQSLDVGTRSTLWHSHTVAKVLTERGVGNLSRVSFVLDDKRKLVDFAARVVRTNGEIQEIDLDSALEETTTDATSNKSTRRVKLRLPGVEAGSLVEIVWTLEYAFALSSMTIKIADDYAPIQKYDLRVRAHNNVPFQLRTYHSSKKIRVKRQTQHTLLTFHEENIKKSKTENYSPDSSMRDPFWKYAAVPRDGIPKWERSVRSTADTLYDDEDDLIDGFQTPFAKTGSDCETRNCLIDAAVDYVRNETNFVRGGNFRSIFPLARVIASGNADAFEKALLLRQALLDLNVSADYALATRLYTQPTDEGFPSVDWFNHLLVVVTDSAGNRVVLDPSCERCSRGELPDRSRGGRALLLDYNKRREPVLKTEFIVAEGIEVEGDVVEEKLTVKLTPKGDATYTLHREWRGDAARREDEKTRSKSRRALTDRGISWAEAHLQHSTTSSVQYTPYRKRLGRISAKIQFESPGYGVVDGDRLVVPLTFLLPAYGKSIREAKKETRVGDFFFSKRVVRVEHVEVIPPKGFEVMTLPQPVSEDGPAFSTVTTWKYAGDRIVLKRKLDIRRGRYSRADFDAVMKPMHAYVASGKDVVVFRRIIDVAPDDAPDAAVP